MNAERNVEDFSIAGQAERLLEKVEKRTPLTKVLVESFKKHTDPATWFLPVDGLWRIVGQTKKDEALAQIALGWDDIKFGKVFLGVFEPNKAPEELNEDISFETQAFPGSSLDRKWIFLRVQKDRLTLYAGPESPGFGYDNLLLKLVDEVAKEASRVKATRK